MEAVYALAVYTGVCCLDGYVVTPLVQMRVSHMPPVLLLIAQVLMGVLVGGLGLALAAPLLMVVMVLVQRLYVEDVLQKVGHMPDVRPTPAGPTAARATYSDGLGASASP